MRRRWLRKWALGAGLLACASASFAGPISGKLTLILGGLQPITIDVSGTGSSSATGVTIGAGLFSIQTAVPATTPLITEVRISAHNAAGAFSGATLQGAMAVDGRVRLMRGGLTLFSVPLSANATRGVGLGGAPITGGTPSSQISLTGAQWSAGVVRVTNVGDPANPLSVTLTGSDARTPNGAGTITLVTPIRLGLSNFGSTPAFAKLQLTFAPEPSAAALLLAGAALAALGISRARAR
jgi:hypothetical protein